MIALEKAQAIYDLSMNERCEAKVQDLFSNGLHKLMIDLIEELEELENRSCENCKYFHQSYLCLELGKGNIQPKEIGLNYCNKWEAKKLKD